VTPRRSAAWTVALRAEYTVLRLLDPLIRWMWFSVGIGITCRLTVRGRRTGRERSVLVGLLRVDGTWYVGHPNGEVGWTANLREAGRATIAPGAESSFEVTATPLSNGPERDGVIMATADQQPFPGNLVYRAARRHILSEGRYFRLEPA
jgi:deazaflavin-dependent oxidoreductase (nitroreductase family)